MASAGGVRSTAVGEMKSKSQSELPRASPVFFSSPSPPFLHCGVIASPCAVPLALVPKGAECKVSSSSSCNLRLRFSPVYSECA